MLESFARCIFFRYDKAKIADKVLLTQSQLALNIIFNIVTAENAHRAELSIKSILRRSVFKLGILKNKY